MAIPENIPPNTAGDRLDNKVTEAGAGGMKGKAWWKHWAASRAGASGEPAWLTGESLVC